MSRRSLARLAAAALVLGAGAARAAPPPAAAPTDAERAAYWVDRLLRGPEPTPILLPHFHQGVLLDAQRQLGALPDAALDRLADASLRERVQGNPVRDGWVGVLVALVPIASRRPDVARAWAAPGVADPDVTVRRAALEVLAVLRQPADGPLLAEALRRHPDDRYLTPLLLKSLLALGPPWDAEAARAVLETGVGDLPDGSSSTWGGFVPAAEESPGGARADLLAGFSLLAETCAPRAPRRTAGGDPVPDGTEAHGVAHALSAPGVLPAALARATLARAGHAPAVASVAADLGAADKALVGIARTGRATTDAERAAARAAVRSDAAVARAPATHDPAAIAARARALRDDPSSEATAALEALLAAVPAEPAWREVLVTTSDLLRARGAEPEAWVAAELASFDPPRLEAALLVVRRSRSPRYVDVLERLHDEAAAAPFRPALRRELAFLYALAAPAGALPPERVRAFATRVASWATDPSDPSGRGLLGTLLDLGPAGEAALASGLASRERAAYLEALGQATGRTVGPAVTAAVLDGVGDATPAAARTAAWTAVFATASGDDAPALERTVARLRGAARDEAEMLRRIVAHRAGR